MAHRSWGKNLRLYLWKNTLQRRRHACAFCCEVCTPLVFVALMALLFQLSHLEVVPTQAFPEDALAQDLLPMALLPKKLAESNQKLAVAGDSNLVSQFVDAMDATYPGLDAEAVFGAQYKYLDVPAFSDVVMRFDSNAALNDYVTGDSYENAVQIYGAIVWNSFGPHWDYSIRMNSSDVPTTLTYTNNLQRNVNLQYMHQYFGITLSENQLAALATEKNGLEQAANKITPGFVPIQIAIDRFIINRTTPHSSPKYFADIGAQAAIMLGYLNASGPLPPAHVLQQPKVLAALGELVGSATQAPQHVTVAPFPITGFKENKFFSAVNNTFSLIFVMCFLYPSFRLIWSFVNEKESRVREGVKMMGMTDGALFSAWYLTYAIIFFFIAAGATIITKVGMFQFSNTILVFLVFYMFCLSSICFAFLISAFFSRSRTAAILGTVVFVVAFFPYFAVTGVTTTTSRKLAACLCAPTAFGLAVEGVSAYEASGVGLSFVNWFVTIDKFSTGLGLLMMLVDCVLYTLLGWYFDKVWPSEFGLRLPAYFLCSRSYWCGSSHARQQKRRQALKQRGEKDSLRQPMLGVGESKRDRYDSDGTASLASSMKHGPTPGGFDSHVEEQSAQDKELSRQDRCIKLKGLTKRFTTGGRVHLAVDGLDLEIYENEITCLLGHNGAGKSTTIGMITGLLPITAGAASIYGHDVSTELDNIREDLGVCPQHDVLFNDLTVREHLVFFAGLKGVPNKDVKTAVTNIIAEVGLVEKTNVQAGALSGGQKRKLSVAIALIGGSKVVILDEPTSGMDPYSRRSTWSIIQNNREGRIILLTTHFMDEADLLGDRICIMAEGRLQCAGSSHFLKEQYGVGYHLTVSKQAGCVPENVISVVEEHVPDAKVTSNVGAELSFQLPFAAAREFPAMFTHIDEHKEQLHVDSYGVGVTTLEEVFLNVAKRGNKKQQELAKEASKRIRAESVASREGKTGEAPPAKQPSGGLTPGAKGLALKSLSSRNNSKGAAGAEYHRAAADKNLFWRHFAALFVKRFHYTRRDSKAWVFQLIIPIAALLLGLGLLKSAIPSSLPPYTLSAQQFNVEHGSQLADFNVMPFNSTPSDKKIMSFVPGAAGQPLAVNLPLDEYAPHGFRFPVNASVEVSAMSRYLLDTKDTMEASRYGAYVFNDAKVAADAQTAYVDYVALQNSTALHATPLFVHIANAATLRMARAGGPDADSSITTTTHPLPLTARERAIIATASAFFAVLLITIAFAFVPASFVSFLVKEREVNAKHQQLISGVSILAYWMSTFAWDVVNYIIPCGCSLLVVYGFQIQELVGNGAFPATALLFFGYGTSVAAFTYCMSYLFKSHSSAQNVVLVVNLLVFLLLIVSSVMSAIESTCEVNKILSYFFRLLPGFSLGSGLLHLATIQVLPFVNTDCGKIPFDEAVKKTYTPFDADVTGRDLWYLFGLTLGYLAVAICIDVLLSYPSVRAFVFRDKDVPEPDHETDEDVLAEAERVRAGRATNDVIILNQLRKVYGGKKAAVRDLTFGIPQGQCFGFLGINGAGKTTTLRILSGDEIPTSGSATLGGFDIMREQPEVRRLLGYCPQFDALLDLLTVREHLELYARIKGVPSHVLSNVVDTKLEELQLEHFEHAYAGSLSGGNKRKLSVAIAMIGDPPLMFLDEPSTGMDPVARRFMWNVIARISSQRQQSSVILTTHSMEECEALCTRVAIMVGGRLRCLGNVQHLKARFGRGYMAEIQVAHPLPSEVKDVSTRIASHIANGRLGRDAVNAACATLGGAERTSKLKPTGSGWLLAAQLDKFGSVAAATFAEWWVVETFVDNITEHMAATFPGSNLVERHDQQLRFQLPESDDHSLGDVFGVFEQEKARLHIAEYALSQTTLEQIFNLFASQQEEEKGAVRGMRAVA